MSIFNGVCFFIFQENANIDFWRNGSNSRGKFSIKYLKLSHLQKTEPSIQTVQNKNVGITKLAWNIIKLT